MNAAFKLIEWPAVQLASVSPSLSSSTASDETNWMLLAGVLALGIGIGYLMARQKAPKLLTEKEN